MRGYHDVGGLSLGAIDKSEHDYALWEKRVDALLVLLAGKGIITVDELRTGSRRWAPKPMSSSVTTSAGSPRSLVRWSREA
jgi:nitrile hydratase beta subunit-like protein